MKKSIHGFLYFLSVVFLFSACRKKEWDEFYGRPESLAPPIYQQLAARGNFKSFLALVDKAGYKESLSGGGYWTIFAPTDEAFAASGLNPSSMDSVAARKIVTYALVYNAFRKDDLALYQSPIAAPGDDGQQAYFAYKRKTAYYDFVYDETVNGKTRKVVATNRNGNTYVSADNGNKYLPYFLDKTFAGLQLSSADYNTFYPNVPFTGFNVGGARVIEQDIPAENGIIHITDNVVPPLQNLDQILSSKPEHSEFKRLMDLTATYTYSPEVTKRYQALFKTNDSVFIKSYAGLAINPNNENFSGSTTDAQIEGFSLFIPTNDVLIPYSKQVLVNYGSFEAAPREVLLTLLNSHLWNKGVWPSKINTEPNSKMEIPTFSAGSIFEKKLASNGFFYGMNAVQDANDFRTVYGKAFLDPKYFMMTMLLKDEVKFVITVPSSKYTMFMMSDEDMRAEGYDYYDDHETFGYVRPGTTSIDYGNGKPRITRILQTSVFATPEGELNDLSGKGVAEAYNGEYIKFDNGKIYASGNEETNTPVTIDSVKNSVNGRVYYTSGLLTFAEKTVFETLADLAAADPDHYSHFNKFVSNSNIKPLIETAAEKGAFYTWLVPSNAAIEQAVKDGLLPGSTTTGAPNFSPLGSDLENVTNFILYHILSKNAIAPDGKKFGAFQTLLKNDNGDSYFLTVNNQVNNLQVKDSFGRWAQVVNDFSNHLGDRSIFHSLDTYLNYKNQ